MQKRWDIMVVPNTSESGLTISVSAQTLKLGALILSIAFMGVVTLCVVKFGLWKKEHAVLVSGLRQEVEKRDSELATIEKKFADLLLLEDKLRTIAGLRPRRMKVDEAGMGGQGGPEISDAILNPFDRNIRSYSFSGDQDASTEVFLLAIAAAHDGFSEIQEAFEKEQERLSSIPSINPVYSPDAWISSGYGYRSDPINGQRRFHDGTDIVAPRKTPIIAPADGVVTFAGWRTGLGRTIEIRHGYGYRTVYGHNDKLSVKKGDRVERGDSIALLGSSGRSTGPHLHYEVRLNGKTKNPYQHLID